MPYKDPEKKSDQGKRWAQAHREYFRENSRRYYVAHLQEQREHRKQWRAAHPEQNRERIRRWREAHPEQQREYDKRWQAAHGKAHREAHREEIREYMRRWQAANPEKCRAKCARHLALKRGAAIGKADYKAIMERDKMVCGICRKRVIRKDLSFDHVIPLSCGGPHVEWNLQVAHLNCNLRKGIGRLPSQIRLAM